MLQVHYKNIELLIISYILLYKEVSYFKSSTVYMINNQEKLL